MNFIKQLLGVLSPVHILWVTMTRGVFVGADNAGNKYYRGRKKRAAYKHERRWVMYKATPDAANVPPEWHGWLHHQTDFVPAEGENSFRRPWQKPHKGNLTGTDQAYHPSGHVKDRKSGDYEAWTPEG